MKNEEKIDNFVEKIEPYLIIVIIASFVGVVGRSPRCSIYKNIRYNCRL